VSIVKSRVYFVSALPWVKRVSKFDWSFEHFCLWSIIVSIWFDLYCLLLSIAFAWWIKSLDVYVNPGYIPSKTLRQVVVEIIPPKICGRSGWYSRSFYEPTMLCAGYAIGLKDSCGGDSGGPLQCFDVSGRWKLAGVVSFGKGCANRHKPGVYTSIARMLHWIETYIPSRPLYYLYCIVLYCIILYCIIFIIFILYYIIEIILY